MPYGKTYRTIEAAIGILQFACILIAIVVGTILFKELVR